MAKASPPAFSDSDYQAENDLHHLTKAAEIKADKKRHTKALNMAKDKIKKLMGVADQGEKVGAPKAPAAPKKTPTTNVM